MRSFVPVLALCLSTTAMAASKAELTTESKVAVKALASSLKQEIQSAMKSGGPLNAVQACNAVAMPITAQVRENQGLDISRTALKYRNPENAPDAWERQVMADFQARRGDGEALKGMTHAEIVAEDGQRVFRFMQAIPTQEACLQCHGSNLDPKLEQRLDALYPQDQARGFAQGDLRGAFSVRKPL